MEAIDIIVIVAATLAALTKIIDVVTTIKGVNHCANHMGMNRAINVERNPIGRFLFKRFGVIGGCWITFVIASVICAVVAWGVIVDGNFAYKIAAILLYGLLVYGNISTGIHNTTGRSTLLTRAILTLYNWIENIKFKKK